MPGVYFVTTTEPRTGKKTQVTAVFPGRNQSVSVKADNDRKMAEIASPQKNKTVHFVDKPSTIITPSEAVHPLHHGTHCSPQHQCCCNQCCYPPPPPPAPPFFANPMMSFPPMVLPPMPSFLAPPFGAINPFQQQSLPILASTQVPWMTQALPPIANQVTSAPPLEPQITKHLEINRYSGQINDDNNTQRRSRSSDTSRKLRDILLIDDSVVRSMTSRDSGQRRRKAAHNQALRVVMESPLYDNGNFKSLLSQYDTDY